MSIRSTSQHLDDLREALGTEYAYLNPDGCVMFAWGVILDGIEEIESLEAEIIRVSSS